MTTASSHRILVVDDDAVLRDLLAAVLADAGYAPHVVESPEAAHGRYDLIVADYLAPAYQPGQPWPQLERLRCLGEGTPILGCTAHLEALGDDPDRLGVAAVTTKPFDVDDLIRTVERLLDEHHGPPDPAGEHADPALTN
jgi:CheY-like chemotaxis protein